MDYTKYINRAKEAFTKGYNAMEAETRRHNAAIEAIRQNGAELSPLAMSRKVDEENTAFTDAINSADDEMTDRVFEIQKSFNQAVADVYALNGNMIDEADAKILNSGITISATELDALFKKHGKNPTMIRLLADYAAAHKIEDLSQDAKAAFFLTKEAGKREKKAFETFVHLSREAVEMIRSGLAFSKAYYSAVDSVSDYALQAERDILKVSIYLSDKEKARIEEIQNDFDARHNRAMENKMKKSREVIDYYH